MADKTLSELIAQVVDRLVNQRLKEAPFDKSYSGVISEVLFDPDTEPDDVKFGQYKVRYGSAEKTIKLNDGLVHEVGERVDVHVYENNSSHIVVAPIINRVPPYKIKYIDYSGDNNNKEQYDGMKTSEIIKKLIEEDKCDKFIEYRQTKANGQIYETEQEYKLAVLNKGEEDEEVLALVLPDGRSIEFENWNV